MRLSFPAIAIISVALMHAACGGGQQSTPAQQPSAASSTASIPRDACTLITSGEAEKILGSPTTATPRSTSADRSTCDYVTKNFESFTLEAIWKGAEQEISTARSGATVATNAAGGKQDATVEEVMGLQRVENLGDEAYFSRRAMSYVRKGDVLLVFQNAGLNDPAREHWEALVRAALARL